jgi:protoporphyrinogen oxidase
VSAETPHDVVVIGAGPAGVAAAWKLALRGDCRVHVIERGERAGGAAGSFEVDGLRVDFGSHRLHPACDTEVLRDIRGFLGADLLDRPRHGRIRLLGRWVHFPLKPVDLMTHLPVGFAAGGLTDAFRRRARGGHESFASVLEAGLGRTICREFYFPYAEKIWGLAPQHLHPEQARRRVSANSRAKLLRKVLNAVPGMKRRGAGRFFYPRRGFGQISEAYAEAAAARGARMVFRAEVAGLCPAPGGWCVRVKTDMGDQAIASRAIFSTIPMPALVRLLNPPEDVGQAARRLVFRAMLLIYLVVDRERYTEFDAHYFPGREIRITRVSEPKNYGLAGVPGATVLCAELPCHRSDAVWEMGEAQLGELVCDSLRKAGLPDPKPLRRVLVKRLPQAYPIYTRDFFEQFEAIDTFLENVCGVLTFGRQGLFVHDNTHHALRMAYGAAECYRGDGTFDRERWREFRREFATHVVED